MEKYFLNLCRVLMHWLSRGQIFEIKAKRSPRHVPVSLCLIKKVNIINMNSETDNGEPAKNNSDYFLVLFCCFFDFFQILFIVFLHAANINFQIKISLETSCLVTYAAHCTIIDKKNSPPCNHLDTGVLRLPVLDRTNCPDRLEEHFSAKTKEARGRDEGRRRKEWKKEWRKERRKEGR